MTKQDKREQLFAAIGGIDDDIAANALKSSERCGRKIPLKLALIAAALAAVSLLVGFTVIFQYTVKQDDKPLFDYNITLHKEIVLPSIEELAEMGAFNPIDGTPGVSYSDTGEYRYHTKTDPRTIIEKHNLNFLVNNNDNFTRANADYPELLYENSYFEEVYVRIMGDFHKEYRSQFILFTFGLIDKRLDLPVSFTTQCYFEELSVPTTTVIDERSEYEWVDIEWIDMNNGEKALIEERDYPAELQIDTSATAYFTYDGIVYNVSAITDIDGMKEVLADLGVL